MAGGVNALFSVPLHASTGALIGSDVARRKFAISDPSVVCFLTITIFRISYLFCFFAKNEMISDKDYGLSNHFPWSLRIHVSNDVELGRIGS